ncbi:gamma-glutamyl-gamma-aminobutyrate hydrolase family protein [Pandoraea sp. PE-S2R-1]|uniref:gamma-glutamyl-gamma-aminobutyrate hydrolase family protein n=1 Tax=Pandoraea sp. PE-S2R-1 TaxID=1986994 RepID=UPI0020165B8C|nr:type 1 glutamine amidotransferase [Pandoraea sp. PE-S2R-1]
MTDAQDPKSPQQPPKPELDANKSAAKPATPATPETSSSASTQSTDYVEGATPAAPRATGKPVGGTAEGSADMPPNPDTLTRPVHQAEPGASADARAEQPPPATTASAATTPSATPTTPPTTSAAPAASQPPIAEVASDRNPIGAPVAASREDVKAAGVGSAGGTIGTGTGATSASSGGAGASGGSGGSGGGEPPHQPAFGGSAPRPGSPASMGGAPSYLQAGDSPWSVLRRIMGARFRAWYDRAGQRITQRTLKIGISARIFHPEPGNKGLRSKTLQYLEESIAHWVMSRDVLVFMIPTVDTQGQLHPSHIRLHDYAKHLDGLVLQGGADVAPLTYSEVATRHEWQGDRMRDMYELELLHEFVEQGKPILGVCRGCQLINVAFGGTLHQDIATDLPEAIPHVTETYEHNRHTLTFPEGSSLAQMLGPVDVPIVNSIHHQSVKTLGRDLSVEAMCAEDGVVEAIRYRKAPFVMGLQWHPEFHRAGGPEFLDCTPVLDNFLRAARETRF